MGQRIASPLKKFLELQLVQEISCSESLLQPGAMFQRCRRQSPGLPHPFHFQAHQFLLRHKLKLYQYVLAMILIARAS
jgi:hypothetical protein